MPTPADKALITATADVNAICACFGLGWSAERTTVGMPVGTIDYRIALNPYGTNEIGQTVEVTDNFLRRRAVAPNIILMNNNITYRPILDNLTKFGLIFPRLKKTTLS